MADFSFSSFAKALDDTSETGVSFEGKTIHWGSAQEVQNLITEINNCKKLVFLNLEGNTLGVEAAKVISEALSKHPEFKKALWKDLFTGRLKTEIPKALEYLGRGIQAANANLAVLDCSDNALGPNGMVGLVELLSSPACFSLQELKLNNCGLGIGGGKMLAQALLDCHKKSIVAGTPFMLKVFIAGRNRLENEGAKALSKVFGSVKTLEEIAMPQNGIYHDGISALAEAFRQNENMKILNLNDNTIRAKGAASLADAFYSMQKLREINFGDCLLKTRGAIFLAEAIQDSHTDLEVLNLGFNEIGQDGGLSIVGALQNKTKLKSVIIDGNQFGQDGRSRIKDIMLENNNFEALGSLSEDDSDGEEEEEGDYNNDEEEGEEEDYLSDEDAGTEGEHYTGDTEEEDGEGLNYVTALTEKTLDSTLDQSLNLTNSSVCITGEETRPNTVETFCNTPNPSLKMFTDLLDKNKVEAFKTFLKNYEKGDYIIGLTFAILKCSALAEQSSEALEVATKLYKDAFDYAQNTNQMTRVKNFFLIQLGLLKCEDHNFKPSYNLKSCRFALKHAISENSFPEDVSKTFNLFLDRFA